MTAVIIMALAVRLAESCVFKWNGYIITQGISAQTQVNWYSKRHNRNR